MIFCKIRLFILCFLVLLIFLNLFKLKNSKVSFMFECFVLINVWLSCCLKVWWFKIFVNEFFFDKKCNFVFWCFNLVVFFVIFVCNLFLVMVVFCSEVFIWLKNWVNWINFCLLFWVEIWLVRFFFVICLIFFWRVLYLCWKWCNIISVIL